MNIIDLGAAREKQDCNSGIPHEYFPDGYLIPGLGQLKWDGHIYVSGATGAGKSWLINQILSNDKKNRKIYLFSDINGDESYTVPMHHYKPGDDYKNTICVFDDYPEIALRDHLLEKGRHTNTSVVCVNHLLRDWGQTRKPLNEAKYVITFPKANAASTFNEILRYGIDKKLAKKIIEQAIHDGRYLIFHQHNPNTFISQRSIVSNVATLS